MSLACTNCAFIGSTVKSAVAHVQHNQTHVVTGPGKDPDTTLTIEIKDWDDE